MYYFIKLSCFFVLCCVVSGQQGPCNTANGGRGQCISLYNCQPLLTIVNKSNRTPQDVDYLKRSHCGYDGNAPAVCCPERNDPPPPQQPPCFTPIGQPGQCISLYACPSLTDLLQAPVQPEKFEYVRNSRCNGPDQYSVCCGPTPSFNNAQATDCKSTVSAFPPDPRTECCGVDSTVGNKIFGGEAATVDQYPWMALIEYEQNGVIKTLCGAALISGKYVLTAAHCVAGRVLNSGRPVRILLGEYDTSTEGADCAPVEADGEDCTDGAIRIPIESTIPHPQYNPKSGLHRNDIALIRLTRLAPFTDFIRPICLPTVDVTLRNDGFNLTAAGWGAVSTKQKASNKKLHVQLPFVRQEICQPVYNIRGRTIPLWKGQMCAGGLKGKDSCKGDSGGPLMYENQRRYEATGVVSFGLLECGTENVPAIYTNVYEYNSWIMGNIRP